MLSGFELLFFLLLLLHLLSFHSLLLNNNNDDDDEIDKEFKYSILSNIATLLLLLQIATLPIYDKSGGELYNEITKY